MNQGFSCLSLGVILKTTTFITELFAIKKNSENIKKYIKKEVSVAYLKKL